MHICAAWLLKHAAAPHSPDLAGKAIGFFERAVQLDPNFAHCLGAAFSRGRLYLL